MNRDLYITFERITKRQTEKICDEMECREIGFCLSLYRLNLHLIIWRGKQMSKAEKISEMECEENRFLSTCVQI